MRLLFILISSAFITFKGFSQCSTLSTTNRGTLNPTSTTQTASALSGFRNYWSFTGVAGCTYTFRTCGNTTKDTYLRIYNSSWSTLVAQNDDGGCGSQSSVSYTPTTTATYYVFLTEFSCIPITANYNISYFNSGSCTVETCSDGTQNQGEGNVDCGGPCQTCGSGGTSVTCSGTVLVYEDLFNGSSAGPFSSAGPTLKSGRGTSNTEWTFNKGWTTYHNHQWTGNNIRFNPDNGVNCEEGTNMIYKRFTGLTPSSGQAAKNGYNTVLTNNTQTLEWSFMVRFSQPPNGLSDGGGVTVGGGAFVLGMENNVIWGCNMKNRGYAVIFGDGTNMNDYVQLVSFDGNNNTGSSPCLHQYLIFNRPDNSFQDYNVNCVISGNTDIPSGWTAVKVQYNPLNDEWRMFARYNVASTFDPQELGSLSSDGLGGKIDYAYTGLDLSYFGFYNCFANDANLDIRYDNLRIKRNVCLLESINNTGDISCGANTVLPVVLKEYSIECTLGGVDLNWGTNSQFNNHHFNIEKSIEGSDFEVLMELPGEGYSTQLNEYHYVDNSPNRGVNYYRLSQTDYDGVKTVLGTLSAEWPCSDEEMASYIYPNPTNGNTNLVIDFKTGRQNYTVEVYNSIGQVVLEPLVGSQKTEGTLMLPLKTNDLNTGIYLIKVNIDGQVSNVKLIKE